MHSRLVSSCLQPLDVRALWQWESCMCSWEIASFDVRGGRCEGVGRIWGHSGGGCICVTTVMTMSQSENVAGLGLERRLVVQNLS